MVRGPRSDLHERHAELAAIEGRLASLREGDGSLVLVEGPPGIGKTRLLEEALAAARKHDVRVLSARATELEMDFPFGVVRQLFEPLFAGMDERGRADVLGGAAEPAGDLFRGRLREDRLGAGAALFQVLHGLYWLCANLAAEKPLVLAIDDAHWADSTSLRWLRFLGTRLERLPTLVIAATRPDEPVDREQLLSGLLHEPGCVRLEPRPLSAKGVADLVRQALPDTAGPSVYAACHESTGGNPFLVMELLARLDLESEGGPVRSSDDVRALASPSVSRSVLDRLGRLPPEASTLTHALAVLGGRGELAIAARLADTSPQAASKAADALARDHILTRGPVPAFVHPLVHTSIQETIPRAELARLHTRAARILADHGAGTDAIALHLLAGTPTGDPWALRWLRRVASQAAASGAYEAAVTYLRRALIEPPAPAERASVLLELGRAEAAIFAAEAEERLNAALAAADSPAMRATVALELGRALTLRARAEAALEAFDHGLAALDGEDRELALRLQAEAISAATGTLGLGRAAGVRSERLAAQITVARTAGERLAAASIAWQRALEASAPVDEVADLAEQALGGGEILDQEGPESPTFMTATAALTMCDRLGAAEAELTNGLERAQRAHSLGGFTFLSSWRAWVLYRRGALLDAEEDARSAIANAVELGYGGPTTIALAMLVECLVSRGRVEEAREELDRWWDERLVLSTMYCPLLVIRGRLHALAGSHREALEDFRECGRLQAASAMRNPAAGPWRSSAAYVLVAAGEHEEARRLVAEELEIARAFGAPRSLGMALRAAGQLTPGPAGVKLLEEAVAQLEGSEAVLELGRALHSVGAAMTAAGKGPAARGPLRRALDLAHRCGAAPLQESAREALVAAGGRPRRAALTGLDALTPAERRIGRLAAQGLTNREIAERLFLTLRMVERHLERSYRKLDISSRAELPPELADC